MEIKKYIPYPEIRKKVALRAVGLAVFAALLILPASAVPVSSQTENPDPEAKAALYMAAEGSAIPGNYIVVLKEGEDIQSQVDDLSVEPDHVYESVLNGFNAELTDAQVAALQADPSVAYIQQDAIVQAAGADEVQPNPQWSLDVMSGGTADKPFDQAFTYTATGRGVTVAIVDSGVNDHDDFKDENGQSRITSRYNFVDGQGPEDCNAHGTHIAGIVAGQTWGVAKEASIASLKVFDCANTGGAGDVYEAFDTIANSFDPAHTVVNFSGEMPGGILNAGVIALTKQGFTVVTAAGNGGKNACTISPAREPSAITVGAIKWPYDNPETVAFYEKSNTGPCIDVLAPGFPIESTSFENPTGTTITGGTSQATAYVSGAAAVFKQYNPDASPAQVQTYIKDTSLPLVSDAPPDTTNNVVQVDALQTGVERSALQNGAYTLTYHTNITDTAPLTIETHFSSPISLQGDVVITDTAPVTTTDGRFYCNNIEPTCIYKSAEGESPKAKLTIQASSSPGKQIPVQTTWIDGTGQIGENEQRLHFGNYSFLPVIRR